VGYDVVYSLGVLKMEIVHSSKILVNLLDYMEL
jgi:hypothetical protein